MKTPETQEPSHGDSAEDASEAASDPSGGDDDATAGPLDGEAAAGGDDDPAWRAQRLQEIVDSHPPPPMAAVTPSQPPGPFDGEAITDPPPPLGPLGVPYRRWALVVVAAVIVAVGWARYSDSQRRDGRGVRVGEGAPATIHLQVRTEPDGASLAIDGAAVANPYGVDVPGGGTHLIEASADGYKSAAKWVEFDRDRSIAMELPRSDP